MPDDTTHSIAISAAGASGGLIGGGYSVVTRTLNTKQSVAATLVSMSVGCFLPGVITQFVSVNWGIAGFAGLVSGLAIFSLIAGVQKLGGQFEKDPRKAIGDVIAGRNATPEEHKP